jgi:hypothetical protein
LGRVLFIKSRHIRAKHCQPFDWLSIDEHAPCDGKSCDAIGSGLTAAINGRQQYQNQRYPDKCMRHRISALKIEIGRRRTVAATASNELVVEVENRRF